jgi:hypothetical protein
MQTIFGFVLNHRRVAILLVLLAVAAELKAKLSMGMLRRHQSTFCISTQI